jgi:hypothetical protein
MAITNNKLKQLAKLHSQTLQESVNSLEEEILKKDEDYDKAKIAYLVSKVNSDYSTLYFYLKEMGTF